LQVKQQPELQVKQQPELQVKQQLHPQSQQVKQQVTQQSSQQIQQIEKTNILVTICCKDEDRIQRMNQIREIAKTMNCEIEVSFKRE
jgi:hypothetical protein